MYNQIYEQYKVFQKILIAQTIGNQAACGGKYCVQLSLTKSDNIWCG